MLPFILIIVEHQGFWSVWMNVFAEYEEVQKALIKSHLGTNMSYFPAFAQDFV
ncbi:MAG: hypothetical protein ACPG5B_16505 [Chitinophagales bacterium]